MNLLHKMLCSLNCKSESISDIDDIKYADYLIQYTLPEIITFEWKNLLDDPPKNSSKKTLDELLLLSKLTLNRTDKDLLLIKQVDNDPSIIVKNILKKYDLQFPQNLFDELYANTKYLIYNIKYFYNRPRPSQLAKIYNIKIDVIDSDTIKTPSYPSGHTVYAKLASELAINFYPKLIDELNYAVKLVGYARMSQGVHFPTDNEASIKLGKFLYNNLKTKIGVT